MERLKQTAQQNVVHAKALHEDLPRKIESVKKLVSEEKYEDADEEMRKWRRQTEMLQEQIDNQLNIIRDKGRQNFLEVSPDNFTRILHDYSDNKKGFIIWKSAIEELI